MIIMTNDKKVLSEKEREEIEKAWERMTDKFWKPLNIGRNIIQRNIESFGEIIKN
jgi:hypothetical protein